MSKYNTFPVDPTRRRVLREQQRAAKTGGSYTPSADDLRELIADGCLEAGGPEIYAERLGCAPGLLRAVIAGRRRACGRMLDVIGLEWIAKSGVFADPQRDSRARTAYAKRMAAALDIYGGRATMRSMAQIERARARAGQPSLFPVHPSVEAKTTISDEDLREVLGPT